MKRDFKDFKEQRPEAAGETGGGFDAEQAAAFAKRYEGMGQDQIMGEILREAAASRKDGSFDPEGIRRFAAQIRPGLNGEQRRQLDLVLKQLGLG